MGVTLTRPVNARTKKGASRKRRTLLLLGVLVALVCIAAGAAGGWWVAGKRSAGFVSTAVVVVNPLPGNAYRDAAEADVITLQTDAQQARSDGVLSVAVNASDVATGIDVLRRRISVEVAPGSQIIRIAYSGSSPDATQSVATTLGEAYLSQRRQRAVDVRDTQMATVQRAVSRVERDLADSEGAAESRMLQRRLVLLSEQSRDIEEQTLNPGNLLDVPTASASRQIRQIVAAAIGGGVGLLFGVWLARRLARRSH